MASGCEASGAISEGSASSAALRTVQSSSLFAALNRVQTSAMLLGAVALGCGSSAAVSGATRTARLKPMTPRRTAKVVETADTGIRRSVRAEDDEAAASNEAGASNAGLILDLSNWSALLFRLTGDTNLILLLSNTRALLLRLGGEGTAGKSAKLSSALLTSRGGGGGSGIAADCCLRA